MDYPNQQFNCDVCLVRISFKILKKELQWFMFVCLCSIDTHVASFLVLETPGKLMKSSINLKKLKESLIFLKKRRNMSFVMTKK